MEESGWGLGRQVRGAALPPPCKVLVQAVGSVTTPVTLWLLQPALRGQEVLGITQKAALSR